MAVGDVVSTRPSILPGWWCCVLKWGKGNINCISSMVKKYDAVIGEIVGISRILLEEVLEITQKHHFPIKNLFGFRAGKHEKEPRFFEIDTILSFPCYFRCPKSCFSNFEKIPKRFASLQDYICGEVVIQSRSTEKSSFWKWYDTMLNFRLATLLLYSRLVFWGFDHVGRNKRVGVHLLETLGITEVLWSVMQCCAVLCSVM